MFVLVMSDDEKALRGNVSYQLYRNSRQRVSSKYIFCVRLLNSAEIAIERRELRSCHHHIWSSVSMSLLGFCCVASERREKALPLSKPDRIRVSVSWNWRWLWKLWRSSDRGPSLGCVGFSILLLIWILSRQALNLLSRSFLSRFVRPRSIELL